MITNKSELAGYLEQDRISLGKKRKPNLMGDDVISLKLYCKNVSIIKTRLRISLHSRFMSSYISTCLLNWDLRYS